MIISIESNYVYVLCHYLKEGTGYPCAGQNNTTEDPAPISINTPFTMPVIAGALLPTGSNHLCNKCSAS